MWYVVVAVVVKVDIAVRKSAGAAVPRQSAMPCRLFNIAHPCARHSRAKIWPWLSMAACRLQYLLQYSSDHCMPAEKPSPSATSVFETLSGLPQCDLSAEWTALTCGSHACFDLPAMPKVLSLPLILVLPLVFSFLPPQIDCVFVSCRTRAGASPSLVLIALSNEPQSGFTGQSILRVLYPSGIVAPTGVPLKMPGAWNHGYGRPEYFKAQPIDLKTI